MRICIITPGQIGSNPRVVKEADALVEAGHDVHVIATKFSDFVEPLDQSIIARANWSLQRIAFANALDWRLARLRQEAAKAAFKLSGSFRYVPQAHSPIAHRLAALAANTPAELYIAHYVAALPAAAHAAALHGAAYAFDAEDFHLGDLPDAEVHRWKKRLLHEIESRFLPGATYISAAAPLIAEAYAQAYGVPKPTVVLNTFPRGNAPQSATAKGTASPGPSIYWFSQTIGPGRGIETAIKAMSLCKSSPHLYVRGTPAKGYIDLVQDLSRSNHVADRFHILPPALPDKMEKMASIYDLGYSGETGFSSNNTMALGNKLFTYIISGLPILASDTLAHKHMASGLGDAMRIFSGAAELAEAIDSYLLQPERLAAARVAAWRLGQDRFNFETEAETLVSLVETSLLRQSRGKATL